MNKILITGSAGGIGGALTEYLSIKSMERKFSDSHLDTSHSCTFNVVGNYDKREHWEGALKGVDTVIHLAAFAHTDKFSTRDMFETNVQVTQKLFELSIQHRVKHFIFISSIAAVAESSNAPLDETITPLPVSEYGKSKYEGEEIIRKLSTTDGAPATTIVRAPTVFGVGCKGGLQTLIRFCFDYPVLPFGSCTSQRSYLSLTTFLSIIELILLSEAFNGVRLYHVAQPGTLSVREIAEMVIAECTLKKRICSLPEWLFKGASRIGDLYSNIATSPLTSHKVRQLFSSLEVSHDKIIKDFPGLSMPNVRESLSEYIRSFNKEIMI